MNTENKQPSDLHQIGDLMAALLDDIAEEWFTSGHWDSKLERANFLRKAWKEIRQGS